MERTTRINCKETERASKRATQRASDGSDCEPNILQMCVMKSTKTPWHLIYILYTLHTELSYSLAQCWVRCGRGKESTGSYK